MFRREAKNKTNPFPSPLTKKKKENLFPLIEMITKKKNEKRVLKNKRKTKDAVVVVVCICCYVLLLGSII